MFEPAIFANGELARSMATQAASLSERVRGGGEAPPGAGCRRRPPCANPRAVAPRAPVPARPQAIELRPDNPRAHLASAVALGRLGARRGRGAAARAGTTLTWRRPRFLRFAARAALWSSNQRKIEISRTVRERVTAALALSPDDDVALHILGRWEYEMSCVGFAVRMVVKMVYGGLEVGSLAAAHRCLARAIELRPERLVHRVVMARILQKMGQQEEAVLQLEAALGLSVEDVNAEHERAEATRMMLKLGRSVQFAAAPPRPQSAAAAQPAPQQQQQQQQQPAPQQQAPRSSDGGVRRSSSSEGIAAKGLPPRKTRSEDGPARPLAGLQPAYC